VGVAVIFPAGSLAQSTYGLIVCFICFGVYTAWSPFVDPNEDRLAQLAQTTIFMVLVSAIVLRANAADPDPATEGAMDIILLVLTIGPMVLAVWLETPLPRLAESAAEKLRSKLNVCGQTVRSRCNTFMGTAKSRLPQRQERRSLASKLKLDLDKLRTSRSAEDGPGTNRSSDSSSGRCKLNRSNKQDEATSRSSRATGARNMAWPELAWPDLSALQFLSATRDSAARSSRDTTTRNGDRADDAQPRGGVIENLSHVFEAWIFGRGNDEPQRQ
jgi:hypothetical protein